MYIQIDGVAMGSPLGVLFANFYMGTVENRVFSLHPELLPPIYARYVDDIFISTGSEEEILTIVNAFKQNSSLNYTHELEIDCKLPFLDTLVHRGPNSFSTEVYVKATNLGFCLNGASECPERYRRSVINSFVKRALTHCSTWNATNAELRRVSQVLANNGYPKLEVDEVIKRQLDNFMKQDLPRQETPLKLDLYYKNHMSSAYKEEEKALKRIIYNNVTPVNPDTNLNLVIYYKTRRTSSLVMKNSCLPQTSPLQEVNLVYQYSCNIGDCSRLNSRYIGFTTTTLSKRITAHLQDGAILRHNISTHGSPLTRQQLEAHTINIHKEPDRRRLKMAESVLIHLENPSINVQQQPESSLPSSRRNVRQHSSRPALRGLPVE